MATNRDIAQEIMHAIAAGSPDYVITQLTQEREDKIKSQGLAGAVPTTETILKTAYAKVAGRAAGTADPGAKVTIPTATVIGEDDNGIIDASVAGYDPDEYAVYYTGSGTSGSGSVSKVAGYVIIGLLGVVLLDRLMGGR